MIPTAACDPTPFRRLRRELPDADGDLRRTRRVAQTDACEMKAAVNEMDVRVVEAGQDERALRVNRARARARHAPYLFIRPDSNDASAIERHGFRQRLLLVHRMDVRIDDDE